jgi:hypothetical protein
VALRCRQINDLASGKALAWGKIPAMSWPAADHGDRLAIVIRDDNKADSEFGHRNGGRHSTSSLGEARALVRRLEETAERKFAHFAEGGDMAESKRIDDTALLADAEGGLTQRQIAGKHGLLQGAVSRRLRAARAEPPRPLRGYA